uniref:PLAT domain-containing protein n=1 Tax=Steinernema glaseri TaxID=37863 RepID=A0A1I8ALS9_9BILA
MSSPQASSPVSVSPSCSATVTTTRSAGIGSYSIVVRTSAKPDSGTYANVFVQLTGTDGQQTDKIRLKCSISHRQKFQTGHSDLFLLVDQIAIPDIKSVDIWHCKKSSQSWLLHSVNVIEHENHTLFRFPCGKRLGEDANEKTSHIRLEAQGAPLKVFKEYDFQ